VSGGAAGRFVVNPERGFPSLGQSPPAGQSLVLPSHPPTRSCEPPVKRHPHPLSLIGAALAAGALVVAVAANAAGTDAQARAAARANVHIPPQTLALLRDDKVTPDMDRKAKVGERIFNDTTLSEPQGQSCASCHHQARAFAESRTTSRGANPMFYGSRNAPNITYTMFTPPLQSGGDEGPLSFFGGQFRDGRANFLPDQAKLPLLNPIEMGNPDVPTLIAKLAVAPYADRFKAAYGEDIFSDPDAAFQAMADALARYESSKAFKRFDSKYDAYLHGQATLTDSEARGLAIFEDPERGNCSLCHVSRASPDWGNRPLFSDFGFDNIGVPRNPDNKFYSMPAQYNPDGRNFVDIGLGAVVPRAMAKGQFKSPSLRNVAISGPYTHNGYFKTLRGLVDFYNTRDVKPRCADKFTPEADAIAQGCWPEAEVPATMNTANLGNLHLSEQDVDDLVAYMGTLTDGWKPTQASASAKH
jgi:cytochrome c peroxidase